MRNTMELRAMFITRLVKVGALTKKDGRLYLLRKGGYNYDEILKGDKLRAADGVNLHEGPSKDTRTIVMLTGADCLTVLKKGLILLGQRKQPRAVT